ncbi:YitT family protein [Gluconacetobacter diazotrophicus]|nr:YitT family protein [Gluconacetobacter diazotrophicus]
MPSPPSADRNPLRHSVFEDAYALVIGCSLIVLGLACLHRAGLVTGGVAGVALLLSYVLPLSAGMLFTLINIPFLLFASRTMGIAFTVKTLLVSSSITLFSLVFPHIMGLSFIDPLWAAFFGGTTIGMGILSLARHQAGVGGTGVVTLWLYKTRGWNVGKAQLTIDVGILLVSLLAIDVRHVLLSAVSAVAISGVVATFHTGRVLHGLLEAVKSPDAGDPTRVPCAPIRSRPVRPLRFGAREHTPGAALRAHLARSIVQGFWNSLRTPARNFPRCRRVGGARKGRAG